MNLDGGNSNILLFSSLLGENFYFDEHTVDGRNPAPPGIDKTI